MYARHAACPALVRIPARTNFETKKFQHEILFEF